MRKLITNLGVISLALLAQTQAASVTDSTWDRSTLPRPIPPMVVSWPKRIKDNGGLRGQFTHCTDIAPTILDAAGLPEPKEVNGVAQITMHGVSFLSTFDDANAPSRHTQQYFEILGNRAMYKDG